MKKIVFEFLQRGAFSSGLGPIILAVLYLILHKNGAVDTLPVNQVCVGIFSITALAFLAGGMNAIYQIERLPLMTAILIHESVLYLGYLGTYLINDWLDRSVIPVVVFTFIFIVGYFLIWTMIYFIIQKERSVSIKC